MDHEPVTNAHGYPVAPFFKQGVDMDDYSMKDIMRGIEMLVEALSLRDPFVEGD